MLALAIYGYFGLGIAPVATAAAPMLFEHALAKAALHARIRKEMPSRSPIEADESNLAAGAQVYQKDCAVCHGMLDQPPAAIASGMFPKPPQLFVKTVSHDPPGEIYWKTKNGIRLTGMPAFGGSLNETQLWQVTLLLKNAEHIPPAVRMLLAHGAPDASSGH
jgi:mono/diheme cytochrome c family protein